MSAPEDQQEAIAGREATRSGGKGPIAGREATRSGGDLRSKPLLRTMVGDVLRRTRRDQGRTLADVASDAKVSMPYLSEVERGRKEASSEVLAAVCDALGLELSELLGEVRHDLDEHRATVIRLDTVRALRRRDPIRRPTSTGRNGGVLLLAA
ncbi:helix-turn-helix domain-containing protein [Jiangella alkaliphila]|uniref:Transcriptional regulator, contains XRE-family HTH domain n=1 Tax=Jiangella alkaliphila TaxID=419479 RepID=A0A1H2L9H7_9ACTN|nr:helix-turn-helix transcriptional regulator [Jiangella alkaliphila]SDU77482.1 Transcriptional regulator, contains XRE-family HTH domain [Jiangella alkaliphila]